ncbi:MAG TPA: heme lyase CcmF/NrfE family subunit, partial [Dehalococcoidia bacterium]|nr:heme lyase CcmF/NrfE family subunit [Dehalococcoidia bacterium]
MIATGTLGQIALLCSLVLALYGLGATVLGSIRRLPAAITSARNATFGIAALVSLASGLLVYAFVTHDFSLAYVAQTSTRDAPLEVTLTGFWGGQAGSLLFWTWGLTLFAA